MRRFVAMTICFTLAGCASSSIPNAPSGSGITTLQTLEPNAKLPWKNAVYVAPDLPGGIYLFDGGSKAPGAPIYSFNPSNGTVYSLATDLHQNVYAGTSQAYVDEFAPLTDVPTAEWKCDAIAVALAVRNGAIYALEQRGGSDSVELEIFKHGHTNPVHRYPISYLDGAVTLAVDGAGNVFASGGGPLVELANGSSSFRPILEKYSISSVSIDPAGNMAAQWQGRRYYEAHTGIFPPGSVAPTRAVSNTPFYGAFSFTPARKNLYVTQGTPSGNGYAYLHYPSFRNIYSYGMSGWYGASAVAASPPAPVGVW